MNAESRILHTLGVTSNCLWCKSWTELVHSLHIIYSAPRGRIFFLQATEAMTRQDHLMKKGNSLNGLERRAYATTAAQLFDLQSIICWSEIRKCINPFANTSNGVHWSARKPKIKTLTSLRGNMKQVSFGAVLVPFGWLFQLMPSLKWMKLKCK